MVNLSQTTKKSVKSRIAIVALGIILVTGFVFMLFNFDSSETLLETREYNPPIALSPDGQAMLIAAKKLELYNFATKEIEVFSNQFPVSSELIQSRLVQWSKSGKYICAVSGKNLYLWDFNTRQLLHSFVFPANYISSVSFNNTETRLAVTGGNEKVHIWDLASGTLVKVIAGYTIVAFDPKTNLLATLEQPFSGAILLWDIANDTVVKRFELVPLEYVSVLKFSPNGLYLAAGLGLNKGEAGIRVWDLEKSSVVNDVKGLYDVPVQLTFTKDEQFLLVGRGILGDPTERKLNSGRIELRKISDGSVVKTFNGNTSEIVSLEIDPSNNFFVISSQGGKIRKWNLP